MPIEFLYAEPETVRCMKIKVPVVLADVEKQIVIDNTTCLPEVVKKIDHIDVRVDDLEADPVFVYGNKMGNVNIHVRPNDEWSHYFTEWKGEPAFLKKFIIHGVLHKQIYYVDRNDNVKHMSEDIPFAKDVEIPDSPRVLEEDEVFAQFRRRPDVDLTFELIRSSRLQQVGVIIVRVKAVEERQIFVQVCPPFDAACTGRNLLRDPGLNQWDTSTTPTFWTATANVRRIGDDLARNGYAAELGAPNPAVSAALSQFVGGTRVRPNQVYRFCVYARENLPVGGVSNFNMRTEVTFVDANGETLAVADKSWGSGQIPNDRYTQFCLDTGLAPEGTTGAIVRIMFEPGANNVGMLKIDDTSLVCVPTSNNNNNNNW